MALTNQESESLHEEARQLYERYGELKAELRADRSRDEISERLDAVQLRYEVIVQELRQNGAATEEEEAREFNFDVGRYQAHKPVVTDPQEGDGHINNVFILLRPRTVVAILLLIFFGSTIVLMSDKTIGFFVVPSSSMEPTLIPDDKLVTFRRTEYQRGDIVVLFDPAEEGAFLVKRIVAIENDDIYVHDGTILVNSKPIEEPYILEKIKYDFEPYRVPAGQVFVLGDNRNNSDDSHKWRSGVPKDTIVGRVRYIYSPKARAGTIPSGFKQFSSAGH